jgi:hypothetical protein
LELRAIRICFDAWYGEGRVYMESRGDEDEVIKGYHYWCGGRPGDRGMVTSREEAGLPVAIPQCIPRYHFQRPSRIICKAYSPIHPYYPRISQSRIFPCSFPAASMSDPGEKATDVTRPSGVLDVGQFL